MPQSSSKGWTKGGVRLWAKKQEKPGSGRERPVQPDRGLDDETLGMKRSHGRSEGGCTRSTSISEQTYACNPRSGENQSGASFSIGTTPTDDGTAVRSMTAMSRGVQKKWRPLGEDLPTQSHSQRLALMGVQKYRSKKRAVKIEGITDTEGTDPQTAAPADCQDDEIVPEAGENTSEVDDPVDSDREDRSEEDDLDEGDGGSFTSAIREEVNPGSAWLHDLGKSSRGKSFGGFKEGDEWRS